MADEEVKPNEEVAQVTPETTEKVPEEAKQEELPLAASEEKPAEEVVEPEEPKVEEPKVDWKDKELKAKHRQLQEAKRRELELQRRAEAAEALAAKFNQKTETDYQATVPIDEVDKRAKELVAQQRYVENCNKAAQSGEKVYGPSWKDAVSNLEILGGFDQQTMNGVLATDDPAKVLYELGRNPDHYHRIMELPTEKRIIEMSKLAMQTTTKKVSEAPAPVNPVGGRASPAAVLLDDKMDDDKWFAIRRQQRKQRWEANNPRR